MRRPRRLFKGSGFGSGHESLPGGARTVLIGLLAVAAVGLASSGLSSDLFGRVPPVSGDIVADAQSVAVVDGETLRLHEMVIRLQGIQAPARGMACRTQSGASYDCGQEAAAFLGRMLRGQTVACRLTGRDAHGLPLGDCAAGGAAVNQAIVRAGWARAVDGSSDDGMLADERQARAAMRGLWQAPNDPFL